MHAGGWDGRAPDRSEPGRLPEVAPGARPGGAARLARLLVERYDGELLLMRRDAVLARPMAGAPSGGAAGAGGDLRAVGGAGLAEVAAPRREERAVRGRGVVRIR
ncbi:hypothetical protein VM98_33755 [Streptomyces rubellomurinus subsp. indigoferus]|nr:hypothetical protein VM98_33755 [Streptomyces rubellomurinus subsp. indigoferus]